MTLFNKKIWGGAGLDRLLRFCNSPVAVFNAWMVRTNQDAYMLQVTEVEGAAEEVVQNMYENLEDVVGDNLEQWYFLHEEIPFVNDNGGVPAKQP